MWASTFSPPQSEFNSSHCEVKNEMPAHTQHAVACLKDRQALTRMNTHAVTAVSFAAVMRSCICRKKPPQSHRPANKNLTLSTKSRHRVNRHFSAMWKCVDHTRSISVRVKSEPGRPAHACLDWVGAMRHGCFQWGEGHGLRRVIPDSTTPPAALARLTIC